MEKEEEEEEESANQNEMALQRRRKGKTHWRCSAQHNWKMGDAFQAQRGSAHTGRNT